MNKKDEEYLLNQTEELNDLMNIDELLNNGKYQQEILSYKRFNEKQVLLQDKKISFLESRIRKAILEKNVGIRYCSPTSNDIWENSTRFDYERSLAPDLLEEKLLKEYDFIPKFICIYRSGMSAISAALFTLTSIYKRSRDKKMLSYVTYFETRTLIDGFVTSYHVNNKYVHNVNDDLYKIIKSEKMDLLFLEMMDVSMKDESINIGKLHASLLERNTRESLIVIIDTTLVAETIVMKDLILDLPRNIIIITVRSCLKLEQFGLELCNMGLLEVYCNSNMEMGEIKRTFRAFRAITGTTISSLDESILLCTIFSQEKCREYILNLKRNVKRMYNEIKFEHSSEIEEINYQDLAPFFLIKLKKSLMEDYTDFLSYISASLNEKEEEFIMGTSFGFRHTRLEIITYEEFSHVIRVSPGRYWTKSCDGLIQCLQGK